MIETPPIAAANGKAMPEQRDNNFAKTRGAGTLDAIVVGGGINGIGVFRELALHGLSVLLVERNDLGRRREHRRA